MKRNETKMQNYLYRFIEWFDSCDQRDVEHSEHESQIISINSAMSFFLRPQKKHPIYNYYDFLSIRKMLVTILAFLVYMKIYCIQKLHKGKIDAE